MKRSFPRELRLTRKRDIDRVFVGGHSVSCAGLRLIWIKNDRQVNRIAISPTRKFRTAVSRNRVRRVIRETFRIHQQSITPGYDVVVIAYPGEYEGHERARKLLELLHVAGLIVREQPSEP